MKRTINIKTRVEKLLNEDIGENIGPPLAIYQLIDGDDDKTNATLQYITASEYNNRDSIRGKLNAIIKSFQSDIDTNTLLQKRNVIMSFISKYKLDPKKAVPTLGIKIGPHFVALTFDKKVQNDFVGKPDTSTGIQQQKLSPEEKNYLMKLIRLYGANQGGGQTQTNTNPVASQASTSSQTTSQAGSNMIRISAKYNINGVGGDYWVNSDGSQGGFVAAGSEISIETFIDDISEILTPIKIQFLKTRTTIVDSIISDVSEIIDSQIRESDISKVGLIDNSVIKYCRGSDGKVDLTFFKTRIPNRKLKGTDQKFLFKREIKDVDLIQSSKITYSLVLYTDTIDESKLDAVSIINGKIKRSIVSEVYANNVLIDNYIINESYIEDSECTSTSTKQIMVSIIETSFIKNSDVSVSEIQRSTISNQTINNQILP